MAATDRLTAISWPRFFYAGSGALLLVGSFLAWTADEELSALDPKSLLTATSIEGVLVIPRHTSQSTPIAIRDKDGIEYQCYIGDCGYPGVRDDIGKHAKALLVSGRIVQIEAGGVTKLSTQQRLASLERKRTRNIGLVVLGAVLGILGFIIQFRLGQRRAEVGI